ncbi:MAG: 50S ribosomal protein L30 [Fimbriimonadales bacterium]|nr:50S ribosomal protein L30 [Fimbriimonadales bacterium]
MKLQVKLVRSPIGNNKRNRRTVQALGLRKLNQVVVHEDNASIRGMLHAVRHMVEVRPLEESNAS